MLEFHIPISKSVIAFNKEGCDGEPPPINLRLAWQDDGRDGGGRFPEYGNGNGGGFDDDLWPEGCEMERSPPMRQPNGRNRDPRDMQYMPEWEGRDGPGPPFGRNGNEYYNGRDDWDMDRTAKPQGRGDRCSQDEEDGDNGQKNSDGEDKGSMALEKYGSNKKFTICEFLKARQKNKKAKKAFKGLMELKQSMGSRMGGALFQGRGQDGICNSGNESKAKSEYETFVMSLIPELKKLDDQQMRQFKWKVFQLIDDISSECDSNSGFDASNNSHMSTVKQKTRLGPFQSGLLNDDQDHCTQHSMPMDKNGGRDWWDREAYQTNQYQRNPYQQSRQPNQQYQMHQQYQQHCDSYELQLPLVFQPRCPPPCQPCCDSNGRHSNPDHRSSQASEHSSSPPNRSSYQSMHSSRSESPPSQKRVHYN